MKQPAATTANVVFKSKKYISTAKISILSGHFCLSLFKKLSQNKEEVPLIPFKFVYQKIMLRRKKEEENKH